MNVWKKLTAGMLSFIMAFAVAAGTAVFADDEDSGGTASDNVFIDTLEGLNKVYDSSKGWAIKVDDATAPDKSRLYRKADVAEYITYKMEKPITGFMVKTYSQFSIGENLKIEVSTDGSEWTSVYCEGTEDVGITEGWVWSYLKPGDPLEDNLTYLKITALNDSRIWNPQVSDVEIYMGGLTGRPVEDVTEEEEPDPISESRYADALEFLYSLGIYEGRDAADPALSSTVTRGAFAEAIVRFLNLQETAKTTESPYRDITDQTLAGYASFAVEMGYMKDFIDNTFAPNDAISLTDCADGIVRALNYHLVSGSYTPIISASSLGLLNKIDQNEDGTVTKEQLAQMLYEALFVYPVTNNGGKIETATQTHLEQVFKLSKKQGLITSTLYGLMYGDAVRDKSQIAIDGNLYDTENHKIHDFLGYQVTYYVSARGQDQKIVHYEINRKKSSEVTVSAEKVLFDSPNFSLTRFVYENEEEKIENESVALKYFVKNGQRTAVTKPSDLKIENGTITLLCSGTGAYDIIVAEEYEHVVAYDIDSERKEITSAFSDTVLKLDDTNKTYQTYYYLNNKPASFGDIKQNMVLSVAASADGKYVKVYASNLTLAGDVDELEVGEAVTILGKRFEFSPTYKKLAQEPYGDFTELEAGKSFTVYLDKDRKIVASTSTGGRRQYAYLYGLEVTAMGPARIRVFNHRGEWVDLSSRDEFLRVIDWSRPVTDPGESKPTYRAVKYNLSNIGSLSNLVTANADGSFTLKRQLIKYSTNKKGELLSIELSSPGQDPSKFSLNLADQKASSNGSNIVENYMFSSKTAIFAIPEDTDNISDYSTSYRFPEGRVLTSGPKINVMVYDSDDLNNAQAMVVYKKKDDGLNRTIGSDNLAVLYKTSRVVDPDTGEEVTQFHMYQKKGEVTYIIDEDATIDGCPPAYAGNWRNMQIGDSFIFLLNYNNKIGKIRFIYSPSQKLFYNNSTMCDTYNEDTSISSDLYVAWANVLKVKKPTLLVTRNNAAKPEFLASIATPNIVVYDPSKPQPVSLGTVSDIKPGDDVVLRAFKYATSDLYVIKNPDADSQR